MQAACCWKPMSGPVPAAAAGYAVLSVTTANNLPKDTCALASTYSYGNPTLFQQCSSVQLGTPDATYLSVYVDQYCGGTPAQPQLPCHFPPRLPSHWC